MNPYDWHAERVFVPPPSPWLQESWDRFVRAREAARRPVCTLCRKRPAETATSRWCDTCVEQVGDLISEWAQDGEL